jgi:hypothetical protein
MDHLIIGDATDPHVEAVVAQLPREPIIIDAATWLARPVTLRDDGVAVGGVDLKAERGWIRRLMPPTWGSSIGSDSLESVEQAAALSALAAVLHDDGIDWLTPIGALGVAENKPHQYRRASRAGVPVPQWVVTTDPAAAPAETGWVAKPLGPGAFVDPDGTMRIVPTASFDPETRPSLAAAPFLLQRRINARRHARVVTVGAEVHSATLSADGIPLDWRLEAAAHRSFSNVPVPEGVERHALAAAAALGIRYSAQDWIEDTDGMWWFIDLNPAGQWLFLPDQVASQITDAIARHLGGPR